MLWWAEVAPKQFVSTAFIPAFFTAGSNDNFIPPAHTQELFDMYAGDKNIVFVSTCEPTGTFRFGNRRLSNLRHGLKRF